eukprot:SAG11_NODE_6479_length_1305_cov_1.291874_1_plen_179_part_00
MWPFPRSFDPSRKHHYSNVPSRFSTPAAYLEAMQKNCMAELSSNVRDNARPICRSGTVLRRGDAEDARENGAWISIIGATAVSSFSKTLVQLDEGRTFHIVRRSIYVEPNENDPNGRHEICVQHLPPQWIMGQAIRFHDFGYIGDSVSEAFHSALFLQKDSLSSFLTHFGSTMKSASL